MNEKKAYFYALSAVFLWSTVATAFKYSLRYLQPLELLAISSTVSLICLFFITSFSGELKEIKKLSKSIIIIMLLLGFLNPFLYYIILFIAYNILPAQEAQALNYTWALMLSYLSYFILKHNLNRRDLIAGFMCYLGVLIIATKGEVSSLSFENTIGVFYAILSTLVWSLYWIFNRKYKIKSSLALILNFSSGTFIILLFYFYMYKITDLNVNGVLSAVYIGLFEMGITFFLWSKALNYTNNTAKIANLIFISPFISLFFISYFLKEKIVISTILGLILIIFSLFYQQLKLKKSS